MSSAPTMSEPAVTLRVAGMTCASCVGRVEKALAAVPGVTRANVNLATETARVEGRPASAALIAAVATAGYQATAVSADRAVMAAPLAATPWPVVAAVALALPLLAPMVLGLGGIQVMLPAWLQLVLATPVQFGLGARFYRSGWAAVRAGTGNMDLLVALGTSAAFGLSLYQMIVHPGGGHLYFEASAVVIALVLLGKYLEARARRQTGNALRALAALRPDSALRLGLDGFAVETPVDRLLAGDRVLVRAGRRVPVDGVVTEGRSEVDESLVTGESLPVAKEVGSTVAAGTVNGAGTLVVETRAVGADSLLGRIIAMVTDAQGAKAPVQALVDRISAVFVPVVLAVALATVVGWLIADAPAETAVIYAAAVLVIACPCALGLATPAALMVGLGRAARLGILVRDPAALEAALTIRRVVFDKTGTLTEGRLRVVDIAAEPGTTVEQALTLALALQAGSDHPLAAALRRAAETRGLAAAPPVSGETLPGRGVAGTVDGRGLVFGNARAMAEQGLTPAPAPADETTVSWLAETVPPRLLARFAFADQVRRGAAQAVADLEARGIETILLSGDRRPAVEAIAGRLGLGRAMAEVLPQDKAAEITRLRADGGGVAMVGDGLNDAPALAAADLGIAMAGGVDVALETAGVTLMRPDPRLVGAVLDLAAALSAKIRSNLFFAFVFNVVGIPLAAFGVLHPVIAGAAMAASSITVVGNALLLNRWRPHLEEIP